LVFPSNSLSYSFHNNNALRPSIAIFISEPAERFGLSVTELKGLDPSIEDLILHLKGINVILGLFAKDDHSKINMALVISVFL
jgi:hypothetical protein